MIVLSVIIALIVHHQMRPISSLTQVANYIAINEKWGDASAFNNDEINMLANTLLTMLNPLEKSRNELRIYLKMAVTDGAASPFLG